MPRLEVSCFEFESAARAIDAGADRIELCSGLADGGLTPEQGTLDEIRNYVQSKRITSTPPIYVMVRPRGGDFVYTEAEFEQMKATITNFKDYTNGFVFGILDSENRVDEARNAELVALARPLPCTFHRAIDQAKHLQEALEAIVRCGFSTLLSSGGQETADAGRRALKDLNEHAQDRLVLMPGGGVRSSNIETLVRNIGASWYHSSAIIDQTNLADEAEISALKKCLGISYVADDKI